MSQTVRGQRIDTIFVLIIFVVFAVSVLLVLMLSASTYSNVTEMSRDEQSERSVLSYIWTKVRNSDESGGVSVGYFHGIQAIRIDETIGGVLYRTVIYHYDGWVYELFSDAALEFYPEDGTRIIQTADLKFAELGYGLIRITSGSRSLLISPRSSALRSSTANAEFGMRNSELWDGSYGSLAAKGVYG